jgi:hypothetical protein
MPCDGVLNQSATIRINNELILTAKQDDLAALKEILAEAVQVEVEDLIMTQSPSLITFAWNKGWSRLLIKIRSGTLTVDPDDDADEVEEAVKAFTTILVRNKALESLRAAGARVTEKPKVKNKIWSIKVEV